MRQEAAFNTVGQGSNLLYRQQFYMYKAQRTMKPYANAWRENRERKGALEASIWMGAINNGMRNTCELLINIVKVNRLKMLTSLNQNGKRYG